MTPRKSIILMSTVGIILITVLSFVPYSLSLFERARDAAASLVVRTAPAGVEESPQASPTPTPPSFDASLWYLSRNEEPEKHGVLIESLDGSRIFASHNADNLFNPASLIKLATTLVALRKFGANYTFETRVFTDGTVDSSGALRGSLHVVGDDPTFGDVGAAMIARELRARGITRVTDEVRVSPRFSFNFSESPEDSARFMSKVMRLGEKTTKVADAPAGQPLFVLRSYPLREILLYMNAHSSNFVAHRIGDMVGGPQGVQQFLINELKLPAEQVILSSTSGLEYNRMTARGLTAVIRVLHAEADRQGLRLEDIMAVASYDAGTLRRRLVGTPLEGAAVGKTGTLGHDDGGMASLAGVVYTENAGMVVFAILDQGTRIWESRQLEEQLLAESVLSQDAPRAIPKPTPGRMLPQSELRIEPEFAQRKTESNRQ